jgi:probable biosynthetic protein (TIGR04098 family)
MSDLSAFIHKHRMRWYGRGIDRSHQLRRNLAYYVAVHGFEIGDFSVGNAEVRLYDSSRLRIGRYASIAAGATFILGGVHHTDTVTTSLLELPRGLLLENRGDIVVGSDVWIAGNATVLSGVTIGHGAVVGAGSMVIEDVPPYAVVFGNPARVQRKRFAPHIIEALLELRWWDLDAGQVRALRPLLLGRDIDRFIAECRKNRGLPEPIDEDIDGVEHWLAETSPSVSGPYPIRLEPQPQALPGRADSRRHPGVPPAHDLPAIAGPCVGNMAGEQVVALIRSELPTFSHHDLDTPFDQLGIDSMAMITLRAGLEETFQVVIDDESWTAIDTPADVVRLVAQRDRCSVGRASPCSERRVYSLNMPQMSLGGLSESWLFREVGDIHWSLITKALRTPSRDLKDGRGNRLYATFTRFQLRSSEAVAAYGENERITIDAQASRYGGGMIFTDAALRGHGRAAQMRIMSSFSTFGDDGTNASLLKGQPDIPLDCPIPAVATLPDFAVEHRARRTAPVTRPIFECEHEINPCQDINGVGLLYFAAYPAIADLCAMRYAGRALHQEFSTRERDVFYFANSDPDDPLIYRIHRWHADQDRVEAEESISRKSDNVMMAYIVTLKDRRHAARGSPERAQPLRHAARVPAEVQP